MSHPSVATAALTVVHRASLVTLQQSAFVSEDFEDNVAAVLEAPQQQQDETAAATAASKKSFLDDGFVFGLEGSGIERPKGKVAQVVVEGDGLETTNLQRAVVWGTLLGHFGFLATSFQEILQLNNGDLSLTSAQAVMLVASSWAMADLGSGVLHWSVDNYGNGRTPVMGGIIAAFQGHHSARPFATFFLTIFCALEIGSQEFHKWSHMTKGEAPQWVNQLQDLGLTIGRKSHAQHHRAPYDGNYCIVSGACNPWLDESGFFRRLEHIVYKINGVESNSWKLDADLRERTLRGEYRLE
ncbi:MAG: hypothetical protein SGILL_002535 [Bacillariaceae sp.]